VPASPRTQLAACVQPARGSAAADIEDITSKTGNFKKFPVFVKMLLSAVKQQSDSVFIDLLTYHDLELLKSKKAKAQGQQPQQPPRAAQANNKRYLILTYAAEFDRVHYPLPLQYEASPDPEQLKRVIRDLRAQLEQERVQAQQRDGCEAQQQHGSGRMLREAEYESAELLQQLRTVRTRPRGCPTGWSCCSRLLRSRGRWPLIPRPHGAAWAGSTPQHAVCAVAAPRRARVHTRTHADDHNHLALPASPSPARAAGVERARPAAQQAGGAGRRAGARARPAQARAGAQGQGDGAGGDALRGSAP
jgi:hypothetical protein